MPDGALAACSTVPRTRTRTFASALGGLARGVVPVAGVVGGVVAPVPSAAGGRDIVVARQYRQPDPEQDPDRARRDHDRQELGQASQQQSCSFSGCSSRFGGEAHRGSGMMMPAQHR